MVSRACKCGGRITTANGQSVCDVCGPIARYGRSSIPNLNALSLYHQSARWRREAGAFKRLHPFCVCCLARGILTAARGRRGVLVDHIVPAVLLPGGLRGESFWDSTNWQVLCLACDLTYKKPLEQRYANDIDRLKREWVGLLHRLRVEAIAEGRQPLLAAVVEGAIRTKAPQE